MSYGTITWIHGFLLTAYLIYFFKFSERKKDFFEYIYSSILNIKNSITGEIAEELTKLLKPIPNVYVEKDEGLKYIEGMENPAESEAFKNWLDDYLEKKNTFFKQYSEIKTAYWKWKIYSRLLKYLSLILAGLEFIILCLMALYEKNVNNLDRYILCYPLIFSAVFFMIGICSMVYILYLENKLRDMEEKNVGF